MIFDLHMHEFIETMLLLHRNPERWLARRRVRDIQLFISGFSAPDVIGFENLQQTVPLINGFGQFLYGKYGAYYENFHEEVAITQAAYDDEQSFDLYFLEWGNFLNEWKPAEKMAAWKTSQTELIDIFSVVTHLKARPGMYFAPAPSVELLYSFIKGIERGCECCHPKARIHPDFKAFEAWLAARSPQKRVCRWDRLLLSEHAFNESVAFASFFESLEQFRMDSRPGI